MGDFAHTTRHTNPGKNPHTPFFLEEENIFKNRPPWYKFYSDSPLYHGGQFSKMLPSSRKRRGADAFENHPSFIDKETVLHSNNIAILQL